MLVAAASALSACFVVQVLHVFGGMSASSEYDDLKL
jgi:organic hydroperoxide reductase OsmC/OhrA